LDLADNFVHPPPSARPWVYWFPLDGNITSNGITADLEAMKRAGIGGVLYMETDQGAPRGPAEFAGPLWRGLFEHICSEAHRLGLQVNMNNDAGWCGTGGPWITPELSMQYVVWSQTNVDGPRRFDAILPQPTVKKDFYRDIAVFAYPAPAENYPLANVRRKSAESAGEVATHTEFGTPPAGIEVPRQRLAILTQRLNPGGRLVWNIPPGRWTILRMGHTSTGVENHPAPPGGLGLESDKLSRKATDAAFAGLMAKVVKDSKPLAGWGKTLVSTHIDSWETGSQNWTPLFRREFLRLRGYDPLPLLPVMTGRVMDSLEVSERFLWDIRQTVSDLMIENYAGRMRKLANSRGLRLSIEGYSGAPADDMAYGGRADEPMGEFWSFPRFLAANSCAEMASTAHTYGKRILGAESFTASDSEKWQGYPGSIKELGDWAFCEGINRFVFHRYALQPWTNPDRAPGMSMGPWGLHYERTETWWEQSIAWHEYIARCQYMLRQGLFVADLCFLEPEGSPQDFHSPIKSGFERPGYNFDGCASEVALTRMSVKNGRLVLPDGMSYQVLVLPRVETMTPALLRKIKKLVAEGATIVGAPPLKSPSLSDYPKCDREVRELAKELWGGGPQPNALTERTFGKGRIFWGGEFQVKHEPDEEDTSPLFASSWIWNPGPNPANAAPPGPCYFRRSVSIDSNDPVAVASLRMTADNTFACSINGQLAVSGNDWAKSFAVDVTRLLQPGSNLITVAATNTLTVPTPAGLLGVLEIRYASGRSQRILTGRDWQVATNGQDWSAAMVLGPMGMGPWGQVGAPAAPDPTPDIQSLCRLMQRLGVPPDFASQSPDSSNSLRCIHRADKGVDLYFVANKDVRPVDSLCSFRVGGRRPELWSPDTGRMERPAVYDERTGITRLPIHFGPIGSVFVVFREPAEPDRIVSLKRDGQTALDLRSPDAAVADPLPEIFRDSAGRLEVNNAGPGRWQWTGAGGDAHEFEAPASAAARILDGPWVVEFPPHWGAPEHVLFDKLVSWSDCPDSGVKYFSGTATYSKTFDIPAGALGGDHRWYLDLGKVAVTAKVELNGQDIGILWKNPYRAEVTDVLRAGENNLRIKVANLWINRMIGDEQLPEDSQRNSDNTLKQWPDWIEHGQPSPAGRFTFTSWRLWKKSSPLVPSGLIGPVQLQPAARIALSRR
jgi:hypothetical protein